MTAGNVPLLVRMDFESLPTPSVSSRFSGASPTSALNVGEWFRRSSWLLQNQAISSPLIAVHLSICLEKLGQLSNAS